MFIIGLLIIVGVGLGWQVAGEISMIALQALAWALIAGLGGAVLSVAWMFISECYTRVRRKK